MSNSLPWFRLYSRIINDPEIELLAFEDQRHYIWLLCLKNENHLSRYQSDPKKLRAVVGKKLGLQAEALDGCYERLLETGLIDEGWNPTNWDKLQYVSDNSTKRVREYRKRQEKQKLNDMKRFRNVSVTPPDTDTETDTEKSSSRASQKKAAAAPPDGDEKQTANNHTDGKVFNISRVLLLYAEILPNQPLPKSGDPDYQRMLKNLRDKLRDAPKRHTEKFWRDVFELVASRDIWMNPNTENLDDPNWQVTLGWIVSKSGWAAIKKYSEREVIR